MIVSQNCMRHSGDGRASGWCRRRGFNGEIGSANHSFVGEQIDGGDFHGVTPRSERSDRQVALDGELLAALANLFRRFDGAPEFLLVFLYAISNGNVRGVRGFVELQVVKLKEDSQLLVRREFLAEPRANFVGIENELARANLLSGNGFKLVRENQRAGVELVIGKARNAKRGFDDT